jgi:hypothetical protein
MVLVREVKCGVECSKMICSLILAAELRLTSHLTKILKHHVIHRNLLLVRRVANAFNACTFGLVGSPMIRWSAWTATNRRVTPDDRYLMVLIRIRTTELMYKS